MTTSLSYAPFLPEGSFSSDLLIATCGYEKRSRYVAESGDVIAHRVIAYTYPHNHVLHYADNLEHFESLGVVQHLESNDGFREALVNDLAELLDSKERPHVAVDISSFCRERLSIIVRTLAQLGASSTIDVTFLYALATFDSHPASTHATVMINAPLYGFEGWTADPSKPVACVIGLGFEDQVALAALETLEPLHTFAFVANNADERFDHRVREDNGTLIHSKEVTELEYELRSPFDTLHTIESLVHTMISAHRLAFIPLGPKPFALLSLLIAQSYEDEIAVWRVSSGEGDPQDREANGSITGLQVTFSS